MKNLATFVLCGLLCLTSSCSFFEDLFSDSGGSTESPILPTTVTLNIPFAAQQTQVWCWAAASEMVLNYNGNPIRQCEIVTSWVGPQHQCCGYGTPTCVFSAPDLQFIQETLANAGMPSILAGGPLSFATVRDQIDNGNPMIVAYQGSFNGHVVVIYGYDDIEPGGPYLAIHDPLYGSVLVEYGTANLYAGSSIWSDTIMLNANPLMHGGMSFEAFDSFNHIEFPEVLNYSSSFDAGFLPWDEVDKLPLPPMREKELYLVGPDRDMTTK